MAFSDLAHWFIRFFREHQERIAQETRHEMAQIAPMLDFNNLDGTQIAWSRAAVGVIERNRRNSVLSARQLVDELRWDANPKADAIKWGDLDPVTAPDFDDVEVTVETPEFDDVDVSVEVPEMDVGVVVDAPEFDEREATVSLLVTGPERVKAAMPAPEDETIATAERSSAAAAVRHVIDGGREQVKDAVRKDPEALGYARVPDSNPCYFCAALTSRGPVYEFESFDDSDARFTGAGTAKVHDGCCCTLVPAYTRNAWPEGSGDLRREWDDVTKDLIGKDAMRAFRREYEARKRGTAQRGPRKSEQYAPATRPKSPSKRAPVTVAETKSDIANRHLPTLRKTLDRLIADGMGEDSPPVQYHRKQIARFEGYLQ